MSACCSHIIASLPALPYPQFLSWVFAPLLATIAFFLLFGLTAPFQTAFDTAALLLFYPQFLSWVFAPVLAAIASFLLFGLIRTFILRRDNAHQVSLWLLPVFVFVTFFVVTWFTIVK